LIVGVWIVLADDVVTDHPTRRLPDAELVVFEDSAHMTFAEENDRYLATVRRFLDRITT